MMKMRPCELCNAEASVFCNSDAAFLCWSCDAKVHEANFLVARHSRSAVCPICNNWTVEYVGYRPSPASCASCESQPASDDDDLSSLSSSTSCISSTTSPAKEYTGGWRSDSSSAVISLKSSSKSRINNLKVEGIFVNWCGKLGMDPGSVVRAACRALKVCVERWTALPFRVCLAASLWLGLRLNLGKSAVSLKVLKRLEEISGVPAKIILAAESKLGQALRRGEVEHRRRIELEEGWAES